MVRSLSLLVFLIVASCGTRIGLAPPPNLYRAGTNYPEERVAPVLRTAAPQIFFVTNREPEGESYGSGRSLSMAFGISTVQFGKDLNWDQLLVRTRADSDADISTLWVKGTEEIVRFSGTPLPFERVDNRLVEVAKAKDLYQQQTRAFQDRVRQKIRDTGNRRLLIYVHGFNNEFDDSLTALANLWHFSGRDSIPIAFTWPAGNGVGPLGYFRDRDAGTFSVFHTKEFLRMLSEIPEVEHIDIVAHSRGTEVVTTALRELMIFARGAGVHPQKMLKTGTLIMAAPDIDVEIVRQRLAAEHFSEAFDQINLYINPNDAALALSAALTQSRRLGALRPEDFLPGELMALEDEGLVHFIRVEQVRGGFGHAYFRDNPAVLSDIVLTLRTGAQPGTDLRPLDRDGADGIWVLHPNYPLERLPDLGRVEGSDRATSR